MSESDKVLGPSQPESSDLATVYRQMASGAAWMVGMRFAVRCIGLLSTVILARLLVPADFGLVALGMMLLGVLGIMSSFSFDLTLIRDQQADRSHYDTVWTFTVARGAVIALLLVAGAGTAAEFFDEPRLEELVYWIALTAFIEGFENIGVVQFRKDMQFDKEFRYRLWIKLSAFVITLVLAYLWRSYWALIAGMVSSRLIQVTLSYLMQEFRPRLGLSRWREIFHFSKWLALNNILIFMSTRADTFIVGKLTGVHTVGLYKIGFEISNLPTTELVWPIQRAIFPGYAKMGENLESIRGAYLNVLGVALMLAVPMGVGIGLVAEPLVQVFLGDKWLGAIPLLQVLAIFGVIRVGMANAGSVLLALGKPHVLTILAAIGVSFRIPVLIWATMEAGAIGAAWAMTGTAFFSLLLNIGTVTRIIGVGPAALLRTVWRPLFAVGVMAAVVLTAQGAWPELGVISAALAELLVLAAIGALAYVGTLLAAWKLSGCPKGAEQQVLGLLHSKLAKRRAA